MERQTDAVAFFEQRLDLLSLDRVSRDVKLLAGLLAGLDAARRANGESREEALAIAR